VWTYGRADFVHGRFAVTLLQGIPVADVADQAAIGVDLRIAGGEACSGMDEVAIGLVELRVARGELRRRRLSAAGGDHRLLVAVFMAADHAVRILLSRSLVSSPHVSVFDRSNSSDLTYVIALCIATFKLLAFVAASKSVAFMMRPLRGVAGRLVALVVAEVDAHIGAGIFSRFLGHRQSGACAKSCCSGGSSLSN
jgi:hypothetical protein